MAKTYTQILRQIEDLQAQAENVRRKEIDGVVKRIREAIEHYGLTAADLGLGAGGARKAAGPARKKPGRKPGRPRKTPGKTSKTPGKTSKVAPKYRDENGNTWAGRGKRPIWLRDALAAGKKLEDFTIK